MKINEDILGFGKKGSVFTLNRNEEGTLFKRRQKNLELYLLMILKKS